MKVTEIVDSETESYLGPNSNRSLSPCIQIYHRFGKDITTVGGKQYHHVCLGLCVMPFQILKIHLRKTTSNTIRNTQRVRCCIMVNLTQFQTSKLILNLQIKFHKSINICFPFFKKKIVFLLKNFNSVLNFVSHYMQRQGQSGKQQYQIFHDWILFILIKWIRTGGEK